MVEVLSAFEEHRSLLFSIAYRMTGSAADAEDLVQETYLRASRAGNERIENPRAWLASIVTRLALDLLKSARRTREEYVGPWLPEPVIVNAPDEPDLESISFAFMTLLEQLSADERAVLVLREVFHYEFDEIASIIGKSAANCRQLLHRARGHLGTTGPRFTPDRSEHRRLVDGFLASVRDGDAARLERLLAPGVTSWSDGGGKATAARRPIEGREGVMKLFLGLGRLAPAEFSARIIDVNGQPAIVGFIGATLNNIIFLQVEDGVVTAIRTVLNPEKLEFVRQQLT